MYLSLFISSNEQTEYSSQTIVCDHNMYYSPYQIETPQTARQSTVASVWPPSDDNPIIQQITVELEGFVSPSHVYCRRHGL